MKKFVCLLLVAMLALSLSVTAFARGDSCDACGAMGTVNWSSEKRRTEEGHCPYGDHHTVYVYYKNYVCRNCGAIADTMETRRVISCRWCNG